MKCLNFFKNFSINFNLRVKFLEDFNRIQKSLPRLNDEFHYGKYDLKELFDINLFHSNYKNNLCIEKQHDRFYAKCSIPIGKLIHVENVFIFIKSENNIYDQRRIINAVEKYLIMAPTIWEFNQIRHMPSINQWFKNQINANEDDLEFVI